MARYIAARTWELHVQQERIDTTMGIPTRDPDWRGTDANGHEHFYDKATYDYPTLDYIVDAEHWCDGDEGIAPHDPHMQVDESHYECKVCRLVVEPGVIPAGTPSSIPGSKSATLKGLTSSDLMVTVALTEPDYEAIGAADDTSDPDTDRPPPTERDLVVRRILDEAIERWQTPGGGDGSRVLVIEPGR